MRISYKDNDKMNNKLENLLTKIEVNKHGCNNTKLILNKINSTNYELKINNNMESIIIIDNHENISQIIEHISSEDFIKIAKEYKEHKKKNLIINTNNTKLYQEYCNSCDKYKNIVIDINVLITKNDSTIHQIGA